jgi:hypothetical protein
MFKNYTVTPTLRFKPQQNIGPSHFFPTVTDLEKKVGQHKIEAAKLSVNENLKN